MEFSQLKQKQQILDLHVTFWLCILHTLKKSSVSFVMAHSTDLATEVSVAGLDARDFARTPCWCSAEVPAHKRGCKARFSGQTQEWVRYAA